MTAPTPNAELAYKVLDHIDAHPESWDQTDWFNAEKPDGCGTVACFAGWAVHLAGLKVVMDPNPVYGMHRKYYTYDHVVGPDGQEMVVSDAALQVLGIDGERDYLFSAHNDRRTLGESVAEIFGPRPDAAA